MHKVTIGATKRPQYLGLVEKHGQQWIHHGIILKEYRQIHGKFIAQYIPILYS